MQSAGPLPRAANRPDCAVNGFGRHALKASSLGEGLVDGGETLRSRSGGGGARS